MLWYAVYGSAVFIPFLVHLLRWLANRLFFPQLAEKEMPPMAEQPEGEALKDTDTTTKTTAAPATHARTLSSLSTKQERMPIHAVVVGASVAGIFHARELAKHFSRVTIIERDVLPNNEDVRPGVPQGFHSNILLDPAIKYLETELASKQGEEANCGRVSVLDDVLASGAQLLPSDSMVQYIYGGFLIGQVNNPPRTLHVRRPFLEWRARSALLKLCPNVRIVEQTQVIGLLTDQSQTSSSSGEPGEPSTPASANESKARARVVGVRVSHQEGVHNIPVTEDVAADIVVWAGGACSLPSLQQMLSDAHCPAPETDSLPLQYSYASRLYTRRRKRIALGGFKYSALYLVPSPPEQCRTSIAIQPVEHSCFLVTMWRVGPLDIKGDQDEVINRYKNDIPHSYLVSEFLRECEPITPRWRLFKTRGMRWTHFERQLQQPSVPVGLIVCGDAMFTSNPRYGCGVSLCAQQARALEQALSGARGQLAEYTVRTHVRTRTPRSLRAMWAQLVSESLSVDDREEEEEEGGGGEREKAQSVTESKSEKAETESERVPQKFTFEAVPQAEERSLLDDLSSSPKAVPFSHNPPTAVTARLPATTLVDIVSRYYTLCAVDLDQAWLTHRVSDMAFPELQPQRSPRVSALYWLLCTMVWLSSHSQVVRQHVEEVVHMRAPITSLLHPFSLMRLIYEWPIREPRRLVNVMMRCGPRGWERVGKKAKHEEREEAERDTRAHDQPAQKEEGGGAHTEAQTQILAQTQTQMPIMSISRQEVEVQQRDTHRQTQTQTNDTHRERKGDQKQRRSNDQQSAIEDQKENRGTTKRRGKKEKRNRSAESDRQQGQTECKTKQQKREIRRTKKATTPRFHGFTVSPQPRHPLSLWGPVYNPSTHILRSFLSSLHSPPPLSSFSASPLFILRLPSLHPHTPRRLPLTAMPHPFVDNRLSFSAPIVFRATSPAPPPPSPPNLHPSQPSLFSLSLFPQCAGRLFSSCSGVTHSSSLVLRVNDITAAHTPALVQSFIMFIMCSRGVPTSCRQRHHDR